MKTINKATKGVLLATVASLALVNLVGLGNAAASTAAYSLPTSGIVPTALTAGNATKTSDLTVETHQTGAYYWVNNFNKSTDTLTWPVTVSAATSFSITSLLASSEATPFTVTDDANGSAVTVSSAGTGWQSLVMGQISVPAGTSNLAFTRSTTAASATNIKSIELVPANSVTAYNNSVTNAKADGQWMSNGGYGLFFQYGAWGYPKTGSAKTPAAQACDFDTSKFVTMVKATGAAYVIWSYTWYTYQIDGPNAAIDTIAGDSSHTTACDLDLNVAQALKTAGVKFILYYHNGHDTDATWWAKQAYPSLNSQTGAGDKSTFLANWSSIVDWTGNHFGTNLDGWWFDDGSFYYPADFAALEQHARTGNPARMVTFNSWTATQVSPYEDYSSGEDCASGNMTAPGTANSSGIIVSGANVGLRAHCLYMLNQDWGVHSPNTTITSPNWNTVSPAVNSAIANHTAVSFNLMMYEDGTVDPGTLAVLQQVKAAYAAPTGQSAPVTTNDSSSQITYQGTWTVASNRGAGDFSDDVHWTNTTGSSALFSFTGTDIDLIGPLQSGSGSASITIDGVDKGTVSENNSGSYAPQQTIFSIGGLSNGTHTLVATKTGPGTYFQVDAFRTVAETNDDNQSIAYQGHWATSAGRGAGDYQNDVHYSSTVGDTATITFSGTSMELRAPTYNGYATGTVSIDGTSYGAISEAGTSSYTPQQVIFSVSGLAAGSHTLVMTSTSGGYFQLDGYVARS
jgi:hypothetical protein